MLSNLVLRDLEQLTTKCHVLSTNFMTTPRHIIEKRPLRYQPNTRIKNRPLIFVDLEFSGFELKNEIISIGCLAVKQPEFKIIKEWTAKAKPAHLENADKNSLTIVGFSKKDWEDARPLKKVLEEFNEIAKDGVLVGYNIAWDFFFLKKSLSRLEIKPKFHWQILDVMSMAFQKFYRWPSIKGFRMKEVESFLGIEHGHWHDPLDDARATYEIFLKLLKNNE